MENVDEFGALALSTFRSGVADEYTDELRRAPQTPEEDYETLAVREIISEYISRIADDSSIVVDTRGASAPDLQHHRALSASGALNDDGFTMARGLL